MTICSCIFTLTLTTYCINMAISERPTEQQESDRHNNQATKGLGTDDAWGRDVRDNTIRRDLRTWLRKDWRQLKSCLLGQGKRTHLKTLDFTGRLGLVKLLWMILIRSSQLCTKVVQIDRILEGHGFGMPAGWVIEPLFLC